MCDESPGDDKQETQEARREEAKRRTRSGFQKRYYIRGSSPEDKEWEKKLKEHEAEIEAFKAAHPGIGDLKDGKKRRRKRAS